MTGQRKIFRDSALERLSTPEQLDRVMRVARPASWIAIGVLFAAMLAAVAWSLVAVVPVKMAAKGILITPGGVLDVASEHAGRLVRFAVEPGEHIEAGQVIARLNQPDVLQELAVARAELAQANERQKAIADMNALQTQAEADVNDARRAALRQSIHYLEERLKWLDERASFEKELQAKEIITRQRTIETRIQINEARDDLAKARNDLRQIDLEERTFRIEKQREVMEHEIAVGEKRRMVATIQDRLTRHTGVTSPYRGRVVELKVNVGEIVAAGTPLFSIVPDEDAAPGVRPDLVAVLYAPPGEGKKVRPGMVVNIAPSTVKREEYGFIVGTVRRVAPIPSTTEGMLRILKNRQLVDQLSGGGAPLELVVDLKEDKATPTGFLWSSSRGPDTIIGTGTPCDSEVTVRTVRLISLIIPGLEQPLKALGL